MRFLGKRFCQPTYIRLWPIAEVRTPARRGDANVRFLPNANVLATMENYIKPAELALLLAFFWFPIFLLAAVIQWRLLTSARRSKLWLLLALLTETVLAFAILLSPLNRFFLPFEFLGADLQMGAFPLQAAILSSIVVCGFFWAVLRRARSIARRPV